jgi:hypothetical protein
MLVADMPLSESLGGQAPFVFSSVSLPACQLDSALGLPASLSALHYWIPLLTKSHVYTHRYMT